MLAVAPAYRGMGVGGGLVRFAEESSWENGCHIMQLEPLVPRGWSHPSKEFLARWYARLGYEPARTGTIEESYPDLAPLLATPCDFVTYRLLCRIAGDRFAPASHSVLYMTITIFRPVQSGKGRAV